MDYIYLGDKLTADELKNKHYNAVRKNGKCIRSRMATMLVEFEKRKTYNISTEIKKTKTLSK